MADGSFPATSRDPWARPAPLSLDDELRKLDQQLKAAGVSFAYKPQASYVGPVAPEDEQPDTESYRLAGQEYWADEAASEEHV